MKFLTKLIASAMIINIFCGGIQMQASAANENPYVKIGLFYGSNAVPTTNLDNYSGSGHNLGYFDSNNSFVSLYSTSTEKITVMKDKNIYLGSDDLYYDSKVSSTKGTVGAYHIELSATYYNQNDVDYAVKSYGTGAFPAYVNGVYKVRVGSYETTDSATSALATVKNKASDQNAKVVGFDNNTYTVTNTKSTTILFEYTNNGAYFGIKPNGEITWNKGYRYRGGFEYSRQAGNDVTVVNVVAMQDYIKGVIPYEMSGSWHIEALKAQALTARSYAFNNINKHSRYGFDLCNDTDCQVYRGTSQATTNSDLAVDQTYGEYIDYRGSIATGFFHSSDGGATEDSENVWTNTVAYLRGKVDPYEKTASINKGIWSQTLTNSQVASILSAKGYSVNGVSNMYISEYTSMGNVKTLTVVDNDGKKTNFSKERARTILNSTSYGSTINSIRYRINEEMPGDATVTPEPSNGKVYINGAEYDTDYGFYLESAKSAGYVDNIAGKSVITASGQNTIEISNTVKTLQTYANGTYTINGRGWGHNVGMSQYGAKAMADQGMGYQDIIKFYFTGVEVKKMN